MLDQLKLQEDFGRHMEFLGILPEGKLVNSVLLHTRGDAKNPSVLIAKLHDVVSNERLFVCRRLNKT